jgi:hypothetical protein
MIPQGGGSIVLVASMSANVRFQRVSRQILAHTFADRQHPAASNAIQRFESRYVKFLSVGRRPYLRDL